MADPEFLAEMEKLRVLVVDDEEELRDLLQEILRDIGIVRVHLAENGEMAWQRLSRSGARIRSCYQRLADASDGWSSTASKDAAMGIGNAVHDVDSESNRGEAVAAAKEAGVTLYVAKPFTYGDFSKKISALAKQIIENKAAA